MPVPADARPDRSLSRCQLLLAARGGAAGDLADAVADRASDVLGAAPAGARVIVLTQLPEDPFPLQQPLCRPYEVVLEVEAPGEDPSAPVPAFGGLVGELAGMVHSDLSAVLVGHPQHLVPTAPAPVRYLYLMRRKAGTTHAQYVDYYFHHHSRFGFATPGILGYTQFHVDPAASEAAARRMGVGVHAFDSVSELHMESLEVFFGALGGPPGSEPGAAAGGAEATDAAAAAADGGVDADDFDFAADEERFVDRPNSVMFTTATRVVLPPG